MGEGIFDYHRQNVIFRKIGRENTAFPANYKIYFNKIIIKHLGKRNHPPLQCKMSFPTTVCYYTIRLRKPGQLNKEFPILNKNGMEEIKLIKANLTKKENEIEQIVAVRESSSKEKSAGNDVSRWFGIR
jgi:hypothetical protein